MWTLYLRHVGKSLWMSLWLTGLMLIFSLNSLFVPVLLLPIMLIFPVAHSLIKYVLDRIDVPASPRSKIFLTLMLASLFALSSLLFFPHMFLFFNALPLAVSLTFIGVITFFTVFEGVIRIKPDLGSDFSLVKFMLSPRTSRERLRARLYRPEPAAAAHAGLWRNNNIEDVIRRIHDLENLQRGLPRRNQPTPPAPRAPVGEPEALRLPENDRAKLLKRHQTATQKLPTAAIIPDVALYNKYLAQETTSGLIRKAQEAANRRKANPISSVDLTTQINEAIKTEALKQTLAEATRLEKAYEETLSSSQAEHYRAYREVTRNFSPPYAECMVGFESINDKPHHEFILMEKRVVINNTTLKEELISGKTFIWSYANGFQPLFSMNNHTAEEPTSREQFFAPNGKITGYVFHTYEVVNDHALSLGLCEHIEKFLKSLQPSAANDEKPAATKSAGLTSSSSSYRNAPINPSATVSNMNIYTAYSYNSNVPTFSHNEESDSDQELQNYLSTLTEDEVALNFGFTK